MRKDDVIKVTTMAVLDIINNTSPMVKLGCSAITNSLSANLEDVKFDKKDNIELEEDNKAIPFVKIKTFNQGWFLLPGTVKDVTNLTVQTSIATIIPESVIPLTDCLISLSKCLCSS